MPTLLEAGWYIARGFQASRHRQSVVATGLPASSTCASAASSSGEMDAVEYSRKSGAYWRQVSIGVLLNAPLTGANTSVGLRSTWQTTFIAEKTARMVAVMTTIRSVFGTA